MNKTINPAPRVSKIVTYLAIFTALLLIPFLAMMFTEEVVWGIGDFALAWVLLFGTLLTYNLIARNMKSTYKAAVGVAVTTALFLVWMNLGVGLIGSEGNPVNLAFGGVLLIGVIGAFVSYLEPSGMAKTLAVMALAHALIAVYALIAGLGEPENGVQEILTINGVFVALWIGAAWLFQKAIPEQPSDRIDSL